MPRKRVKLNQGHYHEVMDRVYIMASNLEDFVIMHPVVLDNKKLNKDLNSALVLLAGAYQEIGKIMYKDLYEKEDRERIKKNKK